MVINCSDKVINEFKVNIREPDRENIDDFFSWHCQLIIINFRKTLILTNDSNRMVVIIYNLKIKEYAYLSDNIINGIRDAFLDQMLLPEVVERYLENFQDIAFVKKQNATLNSQLETAILEVELLDELFDKKSTLQPYICRLANQSLRKIAKNKYSTPYQLLYIDFARFFGEKIINTSGFLFRIELNMRRNDIWCELIIPESFYFESLHNLIQGIFNWGDEFLHDFHIYSEKKEVCQLVCDEDLLEYGVEVKSELERNVKLKDLIPKFKFLTYVYDFDANFIHTIRLIRTVDKYNKSYATCTDGCKEQTLNLENVNERIKFIR